MFITSMLIFNKFLSIFFLFTFTEEEFTVEEFPEDFIPPPIRDDFVIRDDMSQNNLIQDKGK